MRATSTLRWFVCFALLELLRPVLLRGQNEEFLAAGTQLTTPAALTSSAKSLSAAQPANANPFGLASQTYGQHAGANQTFSDTLAFQFDRASTSAWITETYLETSPSLVDLHPREWANGLAAGGTLFLTQSNTTAAHLMANLDSSTTNVGGLPFQQYDGAYLTLRWGLSHLLLSHSGRNDLQVDVAGYSERMLSAPHLPIAFYTGDPMGYAALSSGAEATFSLPSRNSALSVRYGWEQIVQPSTHGRLLQFQLAWSW